MIEQQQLDIFIASLAIFFLLVVLLTLLRRWAGERFTVRTTDILLAIVPVALFLLFSGAVERIGVGGMFELKAVVARASALPINEQINELPVQELETGPKGSIDMIPQLIGKRTEALTFRLGHGGYYSSAVREHLEELSKYPFFRYVVIRDRQGEFFGMIDARTLLANLSPALPRADFEDFARWLNEGNRDALSQLRGFIGRQEAVHPQTSKRKALGTMEELDVDTLPVIKQQQFTGVVERNRLVSSLVIEVVEQLQ